MEWGLKGHSSLILYLRAHCQIQKRLSSGSMDDRPSLSARDYVESLHQNSRATLLYGKNNVLVQPVRAQRGPRSSTGGLAPCFGEVPFGSRLPIHSSTHLLTHLFIHLPVFSLSIHSSICCYFLHSCIHMPVFPSIKSIHTSTHMSISLASLSLLLQCL